MKRFYTLLLLLWTAWTLCACGGSDDPDPAPVGASLSATPTELTFAAEGGEQIVDLRTSAGSWSLRRAADASWLTLSAEGGHSSASSVRVRAAANEGEARSTELILSAPGAVDVPISVRQEAGSGIPAGDFKPVEAEPRAWDGEKRADISYQLLVYSFADSDGDKWGDFKGIEAKLDYLNSLGVSAIWLSPIHPADSYHGYDVTDYTAVNPQYGTMADFESLVRAVHDKGIKVYIDYVLNHTGKGHPWFKAACSSEESPYRSYYIFSQDPVSDIAAGRIPMIASEGAGGYNSGEWFTAPVASASGPHRYRFVLDWSNASAPTVTVTETTDAPDAANPDTSATDARYLYFGEQKCLKFYAKGNGRYELVVDFESSWGFLIRTSATSWAAGTKWGAPSASRRVKLGEPFALNSSTAADILFEDMQIWQFHSNFYSEWMPDLNYGPVASCRESEPYKALVAAAKGWIDRGVDGLRLDAVKHIYHNQTSDENPTFLRTFYDELNDYFHRSRTDDIYMVGEALSGASEVAPYYQGLPAMFEFDFWNRLEWAINNGTGCYFLNDILNYRQRYAAYRPDFIEATKLSNHDEDRTRSKLGESAEKSKLAAAVLLTSAGSPYIYYGEEIGIYGMKTRDDQFVRSRMLWGDGYTTSYTSNVDTKMEAEVGTVAAQSADPASIWTVYRDFTALRNTYPALAYGEATPHAVYNHTNAGAKSVAAWYREASGEKLLVLHNFGAASVDVTLADDLKAAVGVQGSVLSATTEERTVVRMGAWSSVVFLL